MKEQKLYVNVIYEAFMGEINPFGVGAPCTFVRLAGCNLRCYSKTKGRCCDTPEALTLSSGKPMSVSEILGEVQSLGHKVVCVTGGEPLMQNCYQLFSTLSNSGFNVVVETNGSYYIHTYRSLDNIYFVVDRKGKSSGEVRRMLTANYGAMRENDVLKFVLDDEADYVEFLSVLKEHELRCIIAVGLYWGSKLTYTDLMSRLHRDCPRAYLNMQAHKMTQLYDFFKENPNFSKLSIPVLL